MLTAVMLAALAVMQTGEDVASERPAVCEEEWRSDACGIVVFERSRADLAVTPIEEEAATGAEIYRARVLTAWNRPLPVISFERRPGVPPMVVVWGAGGGRTSAPVSQAVWSRVVAGSAFADRDLVRPAPPAATGPGEPEAIVVCADGARVIVEMANTLDDWSVRPVRKKPGHTCDRSPTVSYAAMLAMAAVEALPSCALLENRDGALRTLGRCLTLHGDTLAAATLANAIGEPPVNAPKIEPWADWLGITSPARLDWAGEVHTQTTYLPRLGTPSIVGFLAEVATGLEKLDIYETEITAESSSRARVSGEINYVKEGKWMSATYHQSWTSRHGDWSLESWTVEPFRPMD